MIVMKILATLFFTILAMTNGFSLPEQPIWNFKKSMSQCSIAQPVETGRIEDSELNEASGLVASHKHPGVYYAIQDSLNPDKVYSMLYNGQAIGMYTVLPSKYER